MAQNHGPDIHLIEKGNEGLSSKGLQHPDIDLSQVHGQQDGAFSSVGESGRLDSEKNYTLPEEKPAIDHFGAMKSQAPSSALTRLDQVPVPLDEHPGDGRRPSPRSTHTLPDQPGNIDERNDDENHSIHPQQRQPLSRTRQVFLAMTVTFAMVMSAAGQQTLNIGLPSIRQDLHMKDTDLQWVVSAYSLTYGCLLLLSGRIADICGRKKLLLIGMVWYGIWCLVGGFMQTGAALVVTRAMSGIGAAMSIPSATGIIAQNFNGKARAYAYASFSAGAPLGGALGLIIGGIFVAYVKHTWRSALFMLAGLSALASIAIFLAVPPDTAHTNDRRVDWIGAGLITIGLVLLLFAISDGQVAPQGWRTGYIIALIIIGILMITSFFFWEKHVIDKTTKPPLMRLKLWTRAKGRLAAVYFIGFVAWMGFQSLFYHATLFFQEIQFTGPVGAMLRFLPTEIHGIFCNIAVALLIHRVPTQWLVCTGLLATGLGNVCFAISNQDTNYWKIPFHGMWLSVMGADFFFAPGLVFVAALSLPDEYSVAGALFQTCLQLGAAFGLAITTVLADVQTHKALRSGLGAVEAKLKGLQAAFWLAGAVCFAGVIVAVIALWGMGKAGDRELKDEGEEGRAGVGEAISEVADSCR